MLSFLGQAGLMVRKWQTWAGKQLWWIQKCYFGQSIRLVFSYTLNMVSSTNSVHCCLRLICSHTCRTSCCSHHLWVVSLKPPLWHLDLKNLRFQRKKGLFLCTWLTGLQQKSCDFSQNWWGVSCSWVCRKNVFFLQIFSQFWVTN